MKKIMFSLFLAVTLLLIASTVAFADMPDNIAPAYTTDPSWCGWFWFDSGLGGTKTLHYSNGATGAATYKCEMDYLIFGEPVYDEGHAFYSSIMFCNWGPGFINWEFTGDKGVILIKCKGVWSP